jgi:predicted small integral membrane protein
MVRILKALLVLMVGLNALFCALQNLANINEARGALVYVISGAGQETYPHTLFVYSSSPALAWAALAVVLAGEFAVAAFGIKGSWDLFTARSGSAKQFQAAKTAGLYAGALALLLWFGLFIAVGANFFQMWQTPMGTSSQEHAFQFAAGSALTILFVYLTPD